jgi:hypothetical protein
MKTELALEILQQKRPDRFFAAVTKSIVGLRPGCLNRHPFRGLTAESEAPSNQPLTPWRSSRSASKRESCVGVMNIHSHLLRVGFQQATGDATRRVVSHSRPPPPETASAPEHQLI